MTIIQPDLEHVINIYSSSLPDYNYILTKTNSNNGWVRFSPRLYELMTKFKCHNYPQLYQGENRIQTALFRAISESDDEISEIFKEFASYSEVQQKKFINEFVHDSQDLGEIINNNLLHLDDMDWSLSAQAKAKEEWQVLSEKEQQQIIRFSQYSLSFSLSSFYNHLAVMVHRKKLTQLVAEAMDGNKESFCFAVHIDKTILEHIPFFKTRYQKAQQECEKNFLDQVSKALSSPQLKSGVQHRLLYMLFALLDGTHWLYAVTRPELLDICDKVGLDRYGNRIETVDALNKQLQRYKKFQEFNGMSMPSD